MMRDELTGQIAEIPGPIKAFVLREPRRVAAMLKGAGRLLIVVGNNVKNYESEDFDAIDFVVNLAKSLNAHINVTGPLITKFREKDYNKIYLMPALETIDRLRDNTWSGFDGEGRYNMAVFIGFPYYYEWLMLNGLKHFAYKWLRTISLDPYYHPNATFTLPSMDLDKWRSFMKEVLDLVRR
ncbi:MAG: hypothetical protein DRO09_01350 [Thermoprotei archaeon]|nr:MAG: hypothetical protein DRO09_01350 [Thermoprotei archaeon]